MMDDYHTRTFHYVVINVKWQTMDQDDGIIGSILMWLYRIKMMGDKWQTIEHA